MTKNGKIQNVLFKGKVILKRCSNTIKVKQILRVYHHQHRYHAIIGLAYCEKKTAEKRTCVCVLTLAMPVIQNEIIALHW